MTILLLPLKIFLVDYELASGRPYSKQDELVLRAIAHQEARTIDELHKLFCLRKRLITEILVTLAKAGWIAISNEGEGFKITKGGEAALKSKTLPKSLEVQARFDKIVMEMVSGQLIRSDRITYELEYKLKERGIWDKARQLKAEFPENRLYQGQIQNLLLWDRKKWIRRIDTPKPDRDAWLLVNINNGEITNLPDLWRGLLEERLLEESEKVAREKPELMNEFDESSFQVPIKDEDEDKANIIYSTQIELQDLLLTHSQHVEQLKAALAEARFTLLIASAFLNTTRLEPDVRGWLLAALHRGVDVDLLWGYDWETKGQPLHAAQKWLETLQKEAKKSGARGELRFNEVRTDSHAKLLIYDTDTGYRAYVGSYNWLSKPTRVEPNADVFGSNITVGLHHPGLVANLCMAVAGFWKSQGHSHLYAPSRWERIAEKLGREVVLENKGEVGDTTNPQVCKVRIVHDQEHEGLMRDWLLTAQKRCAVVSHKTGKKTPIRLASLEKRPYEDFSLIVRYGDQPLTPEQETPFMQQLQQKGVLKYKPEFHSKVLVVDNQAIISSYNFLSTDPFNNAKNAREIGVLIEGGVVPDKLWEVFG